MVLLLGETIFKFLSFFRSCFLGDLLDAFGNFGVTDGFFAGVDRFGLGSSSSAAWTSISLDDFLHTRPDLETPVTSR